MHHITLKRKLLSPLKTTLLLLLLSISRVKFVKLWRVVTYNQITDLS